MPTTRLFARISLMLSLSCMNVGYAQSQPLAQQLRTAWYTAQANLTQSEYKRHIVYGGQDMSLKQPQHQALFD